MITLFIQQITDEFVRKNFERLQAEFRLNQPILRGDWKFFSFTFPNAVTNMKIKHDLGFAPKDIILTSQVGAGVFTLNTDKSDKVFLDITTTGAVAVRAFIGTYREGQV